MSTTPQQVHQFFTGMGFRRVRRSKGVYDYEGTLVCRAGKFTVRMHFDDLLFLQPPKVRLPAKEKELPHLLAHVSDTDALCYIQEGVHVLDASKPLGTLKFCLDRVKATLDELQEKGQDEDLKRELLQIWQEKRGWHLIPQNFTGRSACWIRRGRLWVGREGEVRKRFPTSEPQDRRLAYVFTTDKDVQLSGRKGLPKTFQDFTDILQGCGITVTKDLAKCFRDSHPYIPAVFLNARNGCIGITVEPNRWLAALGTRKEVFLSNLMRVGNTVPVERWGLTSAGWEQAMQRNLHEQKTLSGKRILIVGCGTVGSHVAKFYVQSGAGYGEEGKLTLIDKQLFESNNVGRHVLGFLSVGQNKATEMATFLRALYPEADIEGLDESAVKLFPDLSRFDLIVDATGDESFSDALNTHAHAEKQKNSEFPSIIFVYNLGNGDAVQSLYVDFNPKYACYKCFRPNFAKARSKNPIKNDDDVKIVTAACGESPYFPYGVAASAVSASLAIQTAIDWANGSPSPRLRTMRLVEETTIPISNKNWEGDKDCPICKV